MSFVSPALFLWLFCRVYFAVGLCNLLFVDFKHRSRRVEVPNCIHSTSGATRRHATRQPAFGDCCKSFYHDHEGRAMATSAIMAARAPKQQSHISGISDSLTQQASLLSTWLAFYGAMMRTELQTGRTQQWRACCRTRSLSWLDQHMYARHMAGTSTMHGMQRSVLLVPGTRDVQRTTSPPWICSHMWPTPWICIASMHMQPHAATVCVRALSPVHCPQAPLPAAGYTQGLPSQARPVHAPPLPACGCLVFQNRRFRTSTLPGCTIFRTGTLPGSTILGSWLLPAPLHHFNLAQRSLLHTGNWHLPSSNLCSAPAQLQGACPQALPRATCMLHTGNSHTATATRLTPHPKAAWC